MQESAAPLGNGLNPLRGIAPGGHSLLYRLICFHDHVPENWKQNEDPHSYFLSCFSSVNFPSVPHSSVPAITSNICQPALSVPDILDAVEDSELIGDDLDSLLDCFPNEQNPMVVKSAFVLCLSLQASKQTASIDNDDGVLGWKTVAIEHLEIPLVFK